MASDGREHKPKTIVKDDDLLIHLWLCKTGYARSFYEAKQLSARVVIQAMAYEQFGNDYERAYVELNKGGD